MIPCSHGGLIREKEEKVGCRKDNRQRALLECSSKNRWPLRNEAKIFSLLLAGAAEVCCLLHLGQKGTTKKYVHKEIGK
jgi:hypothetical protein